jgi:putative ABC transport system substrate-binding protein
MTKRMLQLAVGTLLIVSGASAQAQQTGKIFRVGFLDPSTASGIAVLLDAFRQELSKLGWIEGKNITIEYRFAEHKLDRLHELSVELVRLKVDLIVVPGVLPALAAKKATPRRFTRRAAGKVRAGRQYEIGQTDWRKHSAISGIPSGQGH